MIDNTVYICTPHNLVIALDAVTGEEKWRFDPHLKQTAKQTTQHLTCRGVSYHRRIGDAGNAAAAAPTAGTTRASCLARRALVERSAAEVTTAAAGVPQNVVTGKAKPGDPTRWSTAKTATAATASEADCVKRHVRADLGRAADRAQRRDRQDLPRLRRRGRHDQPVGQHAQHHARLATTRPRRRWSPTGW